MTATKSTFTSLSDNENDKQVDNENLPWTTIFLIIFLSSIPMLIILLIRLRNRYKSKDCRVDLRARQIKIPKRVHQRSEFETLLRAYRELSDLEKNKY